MHLPSSMSEVQPKDILLWVRAYRVAAVAAVILLAVLMGPVVSQSRQATVAVEPERINPNTATLGSLVRLPGIGKARALDIIHYRQVNGQFETVFESAGDLETIPGIGPKTVETLEPWLVFEE